MHEFPNVLKKIRLALDLFHNQCTPKEGQHRYFCSAADKGYASTSNSNIAGQGDYVLINTRASGLANPNQASTAANSAGLAYKYPSGKKLLQSEPCLLFF
jgi:hypothetical protein